MYLGLGVQSECILGLSHFSGVASKSLRPPEAKFDLLSYLPPTTTMRAAAAATATAIAGATASATTTAAVTTIIITTTTTTTTTTTPTDTSRHFLGYLTTVYFVLLCLNMAAAVHIFTAVYSIACLQKPLFTCFSFSSWRSGFFACFRNVVLEAAKRTRICSTSCCRHVF